MKLELGIALQCSETGCQVQLVKSGKVLFVQYSALVRDRIWIQERELVAVDFTPPVPEIVWRWVLGSVLEVNEGSIGIEDRLGRLAFASKVAALPLKMAIGDQVWVCSTDHELEVHDLVAEGNPVHPDQVLNYITSIVERVYAKLGN